MSDKLNSLFPINPNFVEGEQPDHQKFEVLHKLSKKGFHRIENLLGPMSAEGTSLKSSALPSYISYLEDYVEASYDISVKPVVFNLARLLGPHIVLNPDILGGMSVPLEEQVGQTDWGFPLVGGTHGRNQWQLPFKPVNHNVESTFEFQDTVLFNNMVASIDDVKENGDYYVSETGLLTSFAMVPANEIKYVRYELTTGTGSLYGSAGYNCIPNLSILQDTYSSRLSKAGDSTYGCVKVEHSSTLSSADTAVYKLTLPRVTHGRARQEYGYISSGEAILPDLVDNKDFKNLPGTGIFDSGSRSRYFLRGPLYDIAENDSYPDNSLVLFNSDTEELITGVFVKGEDDFTLYAYLPKATELTFYNDAEASILSGFNSKHFFLLAVGTSITETLLQVAYDSKLHRHDGLGSPRISHKALLDASFMLSGISDSPSRKLYGATEVQDNVHPQYFHREGFRYGGAHGRYTGSEPADYIAVANSDLNMFQGDLVLAPVYSVDSEGEVNVELYARHSDTSNPQYLARSPGHAIVFGQPYYYHITGNDIVGKGFGATIAYYESDTLEEDSAEFISIEANGISPGDYTGNNDVDTPFDRTYRRGLNFGWGNLFFGYRQDRSGGSYDHYEDPENWRSHKESSAAFKASEFIVLATANGVAGSNTNRTISYDEASGVGHRDGVFIRGVKGASVNLSVGSTEKDKASDLTGEGETGANENGTTGAIVLEAALNIGKGQKGDASSLWAPVTGNRHLDMGGAVLLMSPGLGDSRKFPWQEGMGVNDRYLGYSRDAFNSGDRNRGGWTHIAAISPREDSVATDTTVVEDAPLKKPYGRILIEGSRGVDLLVDSIARDEEGDVIPSGFSNGAGFDAYRTALIGKEYTHKEVKFWGTRDPDLIDNEVPSLEDTSGTNAQMLYGFKRNYMRRGRNGVWQATDKHGLGEAGWMTSRALTMSSPNPADYGSNVRNANFIDSFGGIRHDPFDPYTVEVTVPFKARYNTGVTANTSSTLSFNHASVGTHLLTSFSTGGSYNYNSSAESSLNRIALRSLPSATTDALGSRVFIDQIIRSIESELVDRSSAGEFYPGCSVIESKINLIYWSLESGLAMQDGFLSLTDGSPEVMDRASLIEPGIINMSEGPNGATTIVSYYHGLTSENVDPTIFTSETGADFDTDYRALFNNNLLESELQYGMRVWFEAPTTSTKFFPYRVYVGDSLGDATTPSGSARFWIEYSGHITLKFRTLDFTNELAYL